VLQPVPPVTGPSLPGLPAVGAPGELAGQPVDRAKPDKLELVKPDQNEFAIPNHSALTPGDPAVRTLNQSVAAAVIGGMMLVPNSPVAGGQFTVPLPTKIDEKTDIAELKTKVEAASSKLTEIQKDIKQLTDLLNGARDKDGFPIPTSPGLLAELRKLSDRLNDVEKELGKLKSQSSSSLRPSTPNPTADPKLSKGIVRVVNEYPVQISIVVNGTSYRIAPSKSLDVDVPAGEFTYQLLESGAAATRSVIKEKETVTLRIK